LGINLIPHPGKTQAGILKRHKFRVAQVHRSNWLKQKHRRKMRQTRKLPPKLKMTVQVSSNKIALSVTNLPLAYTILILGL